MQFMQNEETSRLLWYTVYNTKEIDSTDWSVTLETSENIITLITCISNKPEKRLCVQAKAI